MNTNLAKCTTWEWNQTFKINVFFSVIIKYSGESFLIYKINLQNPFSCDCIKDIFFMDEDIYSCFLNMWRVFNFILCLQ